jgi:hypothetical protein
LGCDRPSIGVVELQERNPINNTLENKNTKEEIPDRIEASLLPWISSCR